RIGLTLQRITQFQMALFQELGKLGYPAIPMTSAYSPADIIGDFLRHPTGAMLDMRRHPDDFKAACEALIEHILKVATAFPPAPPLTISFIPLHLNEMLSPKLYNEFYWPYLKKVILELVNKGYKMFIFFEGDHTPHVDTILELPKGWGVAWFERPRDFIKDVWEKLKGHTCVMGGVPTNLLIGGTPEKIEEYVKNLLNQTKSEGGFILSTGIAELPKETPKQNVRAYVNAALKYGE
ncbi:MAG: uroporphyrinogen decarboxylase family protein, partial [Candidatus Baldrarchaeia archaeon]